MGGELDARSTAGEGSTFAFTVSFELIDSALVGVPPELSGRRALIVDDNVTNRRILEERLRLWGMTTKSVSGGAQALEVLAAGGPPAAGFDLALLDFSMPEMNGLELARRLRAEGRPGLPLILLTSSGDQVAAARAAGVTGFATKPVRQEKLRKLLVAALSDADGVGTAEAETNLGRPGTEAESPALDADRPRVLVVEDNPINQTVAVQVARAPRLRDGGCGRRRGRAGGSRAAPVRGCADGLPDAAPRRLRRDPRPAPARARRRAHPGDRHDRERHEG
jgi:CheY-like chemotaxis protein